MGSHLIDGQFQSDKYPTTPRGKVPLSVKDPDAQDLLWVYADRHREIDADFSIDLQNALRIAGFAPYLSRVPSLGLLHYLDKERGALRRAGSTQLADWYDEAYGLLLKMTAG